MSELQIESRGRARGVVLLVHGMLSTGGWEKTVKRALEPRGFEVRRIRYGFRGLLAVILLRGPAVKLFEKRLREALREAEGAEVFIIAHSFGTYVVAEALKRLGAKPPENYWDDGGNPSIRRFVLCGSPLRFNLDWSLIRYGADQRPIVSEVVNDCGTRDMIPIAAKLIPGLGAAGVEGFGAPSVTDRFFQGGHNHFFKEEHVASRWAPFLETGTTKSIDAVDGPGRCQSVILGSARLMWFAILVLVVLTLVFWWLAEAANDSHDLMASKNGELIEVDKANLIVGKAESCDHSFDGRYVCKVSTTASRGVRTDDLVDHVPKLNGLPIAGRYEAVVWPRRCGRLWFWDLCESGAQTNVPVNIEPSIDVRIDNPVDCASGGLCRVRVTSLNDPAVDTVRFTNEGRTTTIASATGNFLYEVEGKVSSGEMTRKVSIEIATSLGVRRLEPVVWSTKPRVVSLSFDSPRIVGLSGEYSFRKRPWMEWTTATDFAASGYYRADSGGHLEWTYARWNDAKLPKIRDGSSHRTGPVVHMPKADLLERLRLTWRVKGSRLPPGLPATCTRLGATVHSTQNCCSVDCLGSTCEVQLANAECYGIYKLQVGSGEASFRFLAAWSATVQEMVNAMNGGDQKRWFGLHKQMRLLRSWGGELYRKATNRSTFRRKVSQIPSRLRRGKRKWYEIGYTSLKNWELERQKKWPKCPDEKFRAGDCERSVYFVDQLIETAHVARGATKTKEREQLVGVLTDGWAWSGGGVSIFERSVTDFDPERALGNGFSPTRIPQCLWFAVSTRPKRRITGVFQDLSCHCLNDPTTSRCKKDVAAFCDSYRPEGLAAGARDDLNPCNTQQDKPGR